LWEWNQEALVLEQEHQGNITSILERIYHYPDKGYPEIKTELVPANAMVAQYLEEQKHLIPDSWSAHGPCNILFLGTQLQQQIDCTYRDDYDYPQFFVGMCWDGVTWKLREHYYGIIHEFADSLYFSAYLRMSPEQVEMR
jgi:hypothetical protein